MTLGTAFCGNHLNHTHEVTQRMQARFRPVPQAMDRDVQGFVRVSLFPPAKQAQQPFGEALYRLWIGHGQFEVAFSGRWIGLYPG